MAEQTVIVCDVCAKPATERVTFKARDRTLQKDLCDEHLGELMKGSRAAKRGRRPALATSAAPSPARRRTRTSTAKGSTRRRASTTKGSASTGNSTAKSPRRRRATASAPEAAPKAP